MSRLYQNKRCRNSGAGLLAGLLFFLTASLCPAMLHMNVTYYGANGSDNQNDSTAFQSALNALFNANPKGGYLYIPNGTYDFNSLVSIYAGSQDFWSLEIQGQSRTGVVLRCNNTNGIFRLTHDNNREQIILRDVTLQANRAGSGTAFESTSPKAGPIPGRMAQVLNVDVNYANTNCYFNNGLNLFPGWRTLVDGCTINSPTNSDMSDGSINFYMQKAIDLDGSYNAVVRNTQINGAGTAVSMAMPGVISTEGGTCMNVDVSCVKTGFVFSIGTTTRASVEIRDCDITARDTGILLRNRDVYFLAENTFRQLSAAYPLKDVDLQGCPYGFVVRNSFPGTLAGGRKNVTLGPSALFTGEEVIRYVTNSVAYFVTNIVTHSDISHDVIVEQNTLSGAEADAVTADVGSYDIILAGNNNVTRPAFITNSFTKAGTAVGYAYSESITNTASDPDGDVLTFCKASGPAWLTVQSDGTLSGIPGVNDVGTTNFTVRAIDNGGLATTNDATMTITVASQSSLPPVWPGIATFISISNEDGVVTESAQGSGVGGTIQTTTYGGGGLRLGDSPTKTQYRSFVSFDTSGLPGDATVTNATLKIKRATVQNSDPFDWGGSALVDVKGGLGFSGSTALQATDFEAAADASAAATMSRPLNNDDWSTGTLSSNALQYVNRTGTTQLRFYMSIATDAAVTNGLADYMGFWPGDATNQPYRPVFEVGYMRPNYAPVWSTNLFTKADATEGVVYSGSLATNASDSDVGDRLTFSKVSGPAWLTVATNGTLSGTPHNADVGTNTFVVRATDTQTAAVDATMNITVINVNGAPAWNNDPFIKSDATQDAAYSDSIAADAYDSDVGDTLRFSKISGPDWLMVATNGVLSGTPAVGDVGFNTFVVRVTDAAGLYSNATMYVVVNSATVQIPVFFNPSIAGGNLVLSGANGVAGGTYYVLSATNLMIPRANWTVLRTNTFGSGGEFSFTNAVDPGTPARFYLIQY